MTLPLDIQTPDEATAPAGSAPANVEGEATAAGAVHHPATRALGLDLSLRRTGIATATTADSLTPPRQLDGFPRLRWIRSAILERAQHTDLVVVEGLSYGSHTPSALERAGLWHLVMVAIDARGIRWEQIAPATLKKYATGRGNADKGQVLAAAVRRLPVAVDNDNTADALWLAAIGHDLLGQPICDLPAAQRAAIDKHRGN